jgi:hypothetical protein
MRQHRRAWIIATLLALSSAGGAQAGQICNSATHEKYGETRAFFKDVAAGCDANLRCYVVSHVPDKGQGYQYLQQMRLQRTAPGAPLDLQFVSVDPMANASLRFALSVDDKAWSLSPSFALTANSANEYRVTDQVLTDVLAERIRNGRRATWLYMSDEGAPHAARFGLRGANDAMAWMACMQGKK